MAVAGTFTPDFSEARQRREEGVTLKDLARSYNVSMATISRLGT